MPKTTYIQKIILIIFGVFLSFILLEAGLRMAGLLYTSLQDHRNILSLKSNGMYRILCIGESTTAFGGHNSYPSQLGRILNKNNNDLTFSVINKGVPGTNSVAILRNLQSNLKKYKPDIVISMIGINDNDVNILSEKINNKSSFLKSLKTYKLADFILSGFKSSSRVVNVEEREALEISKNTDYYLNYESNQRKQSLEELKNIIPNNMLRSLRNAWLEFDKSNFENSRMILEKTVKSNPENYYAYSNLVEHYCAQDEYNKAIKLFPNVFELKPTHQKLPTFLIDCYLDLNWKHMDHNDIAIAEQLLNSTVKDQLNNSDLIGLLANIYGLQEKSDLSKQYFLDVSELRTHNFNPTTRSNYLKIYKTLSNLNIQLIAVQYPMSSIEPLRQTFDNKNGVIFIDNESSFKKAVKNQNYNNYFIDMFAGTFGHCTPNGNKLLANNIATAIFREIFQIDN